MLSRIYGDLITPGPHGDRGLLQPQSTNKSGAIRMAKFLFFALALLCLAPWPAYRRALALVARRP